MALSIFLKLMGALQKAWYSNALASTSANGLKPIDFLHDRTEKFWVGAGAMAIGSVNRVASRRKYLALLLILVAGIVHFVEEDRVVPAYI